jgi:hypothetical protein
MPAQNLAVVPALPFFAFTPEFQQQEDARDPVRIAPVAQV